MDFIANLLALRLKSKIHFRQLLHSTQDFDILDHGSKYLPRLDEKRREGQKILARLDNGNSTS